METLEAIFTRRSVREFGADAVPQEMIEKVLQAGAASPSGGNLQARGFVVVQSPSRLEALRSLAPGVIGQPRAVVAICLDEGRLARLGGVGGAQTAWLDIGLATENILLAAHSLGLGACPVSSFHRAAVAEFLNLPPEVRPVLLITLGYPKKPPASPGRRPSSEVIFGEKWGLAYEEEQASR